ncbi:MAG: uL15 family ribosomal protein [Candidatus Hodarchaeota archaeon]
MTIRFDKKTHKRRGSRTHGYGRVGQHRKAGKRGGRGVAGRKKHGKSYILRYMPDYFGKHGFKRPESLIKRPKTMNLKQLDQMIGKLLEQKVAEKREKEIFVDLTKLGYGKLLGNGILTQPLIVAIPKFSKLAAKKVEAAGGKISQDT